MDQSTIQLKASKNRAWMFAMAMAAIAGVEALSINLMMPLKQTKPYFIETNANTGEVSMSHNTSEAFTPSEINKTYFLRQFIENLFTMDAARTKDYMLPVAASMTRAAAVAEYKAWLDSDRPIERLTENALLTRHISNININYVPGADVAIVRFKLTTSGSSDNSTVENKSMSIKFALVEKEISETNPLGFFVTDFNIKDEK